MRTAADMPAADAIERRSAAWIAWAALGALLAMLVLEARDVARRSAQPAPVIEVEASARVIVGLPLDDLAPSGPVVMAPAALPAAKSAETTAVAGDERGLVGMDAAALRAALGAPDFVRRDGRSQMWRYGSGGCTLTVFLHGQDGELTVEHVEGRGLRSLQDVGADCAERLVGERRPADLPG